MKRFVDAALIASVAAVLALGSVPARAQNNPTPASLTYAKEILAAKNLNELYKGAVPSLVERTKNALLQSNLNYQKDLNEVAIKVAKELAGRDKEIGEQIAKLYASAFTEAELKDLVAFYKSPLGKKTIEKEPEVFNAARQFMDEWAQKFAAEINGKFRAEMRARGKEI